MRRRAAHNRRANPLPEFRVGRYRYFAQPQLATRCEASCRIWRARSQRLPPSVSRRQTASLARVSEEKALHAVSQGLTSLAGAAATPAADSSARRDWSSSGAGVGMLVARGAEGAAARAAGGAGAGSFRASRSRSWRALSSNASASASVVGSASASSCGAAVVAGTPGAGAASPPDLGALRSLAQPADRPSATKRATKPRPK